MDLYHILNRGVDGRNLFLDSQDYVRFIHNLYEFNDATPALGLNRRNMPDLNVGHRKSYIRKRLVEIHGWCLMKNHYHLLISELVDGGLIKFMMKINIGYSKYYNERYERHGHLFQGKTKKILVAHHSHFLYMLHYLHLNPLDYLKGAKKWRERDKGSVPEISQVLEYLKSYRWSSYPDYCGIQNFPSILTKSLFNSALGTNYISSLKEYLTDRADEELDLKYLEYQS